MELLDSSMDKISEKVYTQLNQTIPEEILGVMTVAVSPLSSTPSPLLPPSTTSWMWCVVGHQSPPLLEKRAENNP